LIHIAILAIFISLITGFASMTLLFIVYSKGKYPLIRYYLVITFLMTILVISLLLVIYLYSFRILPQLLNWLRLFANLVFCGLLTQWIIVAYPAKVALPFRIADLASKILAILMCAFVIFLFAFFGEYFFLTNLINVLLSIASLAINILIVFPEKNPVDIKDGVNWSFYTKIIFSIYTMAYFFYAFIYIIFHKDFILFSFITDSYVITPITYLFTQLFSIAFLVRSLMRPSYHIKPSAIDPAAAGRFGFSERESEIAARLIEGLSNKSIGENLFISPDTVKTHIRNIYRKTGVNKRIDLIRVFQNSSEADGKKNDDR
jgi:DNA-binding CsgD family transcriptional regulator